jgi:hypothetical protein
MEINKLFYGLPSIYMSMLGRNYATLAKRTLFWLLHGLFSLGPLAALWYYFYVVTDDATFILWQETSFIWYASAITFLAGTVVFQACAHLFVPRHYIYWVKVYPNAVMMYLAKVVWGITKAESESQVLSRLQTLLDGLEKSIKKDSATSEDLLEIQRLVKNLGYITTQVSFLGIKTGNKRVPVYSGFFGTLKPKDLETLARGKWKKALEDEIKPLKKQIASRSYLLNTSPLEIFRNPDGHIQALMALKMWKDLATLSRRHTFLKFVEEIGQTFPPPKNLPDLQVMVRNFPDESDWLNEQRKNKATKAVAKKLVAVNQSSANSVFAGNEDPQGLDQLVDWFKKQELTMRIILGSVVLSGAGLSLIIFALLRAPYFMLIAVFLMWILFFARILYWQKAKVFMKKASIVALLVAIAVGGIWFFAKPKLSFDMGFLGGNSISAQKQNVVVADNAPNPVPAEATKPTNVVQPKIGTLPNQDVGELTAAAQSFVTLQASVESLSGIWIKVETKARMLETMLLELEQSGTIPEATTLYTYCPEKKVAQQSPYIGSSLYNQICPEGQLQYLEGVEYSYHWYRMFLTGGLVQWSPDHQKEVEQQISLTSMLANSRKTGVLTKEQADQLQKIGALALEAITKERDIAKTLSECYEKPMKEALNQAKAKASNIEGTTGITVTQDLKQSILTCSGMLNMQVQSYQAIRDTAATLSVEGQTLGVNLPNLSRFPTALVESINPDKKTVYIAPSSPTTPPTPAPLPSEQPKQETNPEGKATATQTADTAGTFCSTTTVTIPAGVNKVEQEVKRSLKELMVALEQYPFKVLGTDPNCGDIVFVQYKTPDQGLLTGWVATETTGLTPNTWYMAFTEGKEIEIWETDKDGNKIGTKAALTIPK